MRDPDEMRVRMRKYNVAVLGVSGAVGKMLLRVLEEKEFPINDLRLLASSRSAGKKMHFRNKEYCVEETTQDSFKDMDIVFGAVEGDIARRYMEYIIREGAIFIDNSSAYRLDKDVPLVIPQINGEDVLLHKGIISNPNCVTIITLMAVAPLHKEYKIKHMQVSSYQAVSGAGEYGIQELREQVLDTTVLPKIFPYPIAFNVIPQIGEEDQDDYTSEEMKLQREGSKILHAPIEVDCTCVRIPVYTSHSVSVYVEFEEIADVDHVRDILANAEGIQLEDDLGSKRYPMPIYTSDQDIVYVGRIRKSLRNNRSIVLFACGDQLRKGAATNAVEIAEELIKRGIIE